MDNVISTIKTILNLLGFSDAEINADLSHRRISILINDEMAKNYLAVVVPSLDHLVNLILRKADQPNFVVDVNYYRKERERLIVELARAAAHKAVITKQEVELPAMNAYERRLVHVEITTHPELKTESMGEGKERHIVIKHLS
ncbi:hypothetical protein HY967_03010 [Candidatus Jorgensenbacteria bacterium]|nr:hypothetical protein [Candidatus Jorgensenbacteria bacterium]